MLTVYSKEDCSKCKELKNFFNENHIEFVEFDITKPSKARSFILSEGFETVPQVFLDDKYVGDCDGTIARFKDGKV